LGALKPLRVDHVPTLFEHPQYQERQEARGKQQDYGAKQDCG
jgi:hypothetical protein